MKLAALILGTGLILSVAFGLGWSVMQQPQQAGGNGIVIDDDDMDRGALGPPAAPGFPNIGDPGVPPSVGGTHAEFRYPGATGQGPN